MQSPERFLALIGIVSLVPGCTSSEPPPQPDLATELQLQAVLTMVDGRIVYER